MGVAIGAVCVAGLETGGSFADLNEEIGPVPNLKLGWIGGCDC